MVDQAPKIRMLTGEQHREFVLTPEEGVKYLVAAREPLASVAALLADTGMRPEECYRRRWDYVTWINGRYGSLLVTHRKTAAARRVLPMTPRVRRLLEARWETPGQPLDGWVWPAPHAKALSSRSAHAYGTAYGILS